jgi:hypothetical protein
MLIGIRRQPVIVIQKMQVLPLGDGGACIAGDASFAPIRVDNPDAV